MTITIGVLALQGGFSEHIKLLHVAAPHIPTATFSIAEVRTPAQLASCSALVIPGGESTTISNVAEKSGLLEPLRAFVREKPVWGTCAGLILLSSIATGAKHHGQPLLGGLTISTHRNYFGRQLASFVAPMTLPFLPWEPSRPIDAVFIRAPVVREVLGGSRVEVLARLEKGGEIVAVREGEVVGMSFHPELTEDWRVHGWWLGEVVKSLRGGGEGRKGEVRVGDRREWPVEVV